MQDSIFLLVFDRPDPRVLIPPAHGSGISTSTEWAAAARMPVADPPAPAWASAGAQPAAADRPPLDELARLRKRIDQQEHSLAVMAAAISALRDGSQALRDENRALRLKMQGAQRSGAITGASILPGYASQRGPARPGRSAGGRRT